MRAIVVLGAVLAASPLAAQVAAPSVDPLLAQSSSGRWDYRQIAGGTEAVFADSAGARQLTVRCVRATRRISIVRPAMAAAASLNLWTSNSARQLPAMFDPGTAELRAEISAFDQLLDALAFSRGRFAVAISGAAPIVVPNWPEPTRAIEDCRN